MYITTPRRRVLLLTGDDEEIRDLLGNPRFAQWHVVAADSSHAAALLHEANPTDLVLADECYFQSEGLEGIAWLARKQNAPILLVADLMPDIIGTAYENGACIYIPRQQALSCPEVLAGALLSAARWTDAASEKNRVQDLLVTCQRRMDGLVSLMWRTGAMQLQQRWYSHRLMLERLTEETARAKRHDTALTVALGEVHRTGEVNDDAVIGKAEDLIPWAAGEVSERKRRCDIAGQYGLKGFMLLMAHTNESGAACCCKRLQDHLESVARKQGHSKSIRVHFGVAGFSENSDTSQRLLRCAEEQLEASKQRPNSGIAN